MYESRTTSFDLYNDLTVGHHILFPEYSTRPPALDKVLGSSPKSQHVMYDSCSSIVTYSDSWCVVKYSTVPDPLTEHAQ